MSENKDNKINNQEHPEWVKENSLTAPEDRDRVNRWRPEQGAPKLTEDEVNAAMNELPVHDFINKFPRVDRTYADPPIPIQTFGLVSFVPAKGATPNKNGVYGFAKLRGNYGTLQEVEQQEENIIRNVDSYHKLFVAYVGRPYPLTLDPKYAAKTKEIDIRKETTKSISDDIKKKKKEEKNEVEDIKEREQKLLEESNKDEEDPYETYVTLRVKKAQLSWTYMEHIKKMKEIRGIIKKTRVDIDDMDSEHPKFKDSYYDKYMDARKKAGIKESKEESVDNFIKYMVEDVELEGIDCELKGFDLEEIDGKERKE